MADLIQGQILVSLPGIRNGGETYLRHRIFTGFYKTEAKMVVVTLKSLFNSIFGFTAALLKDNQQMEKESIENLRQEVRGLCYRFGSWRIKRNG